MLVVDVRSRGRTRASRLGRMPGYVRDRLVHCVRKCRSAGEIETFTTLAAVDLSNDGLQSR